MTLDVTRRGNGEFAGRECEQENCYSAARYEIIAPTSQMARLGCARHVSLFITAIWLTSNEAAVVKEVPGSYRNRRPPRGLY